MEFVKDKRTSLTLMFMKRRILNMFDEHLDLMVCMFAQLFFMMLIFFYIIMPSQPRLRMKQKGVFWLALGTLDESSILMLNGSLMESFRFLKHHDYFKT
jgi:hypothetical protein